MKFNDFQISWRLLIKEPGYSAVAMLGLSVGIAVCYLLLGFVRYSLNYDAQVPQAGQVYLVNTQFNHSVGGMPWVEESPQALIAVAARSGFEVQGSTFLKQTRSLVIDNIAQEVDLHVVHPAFQSIFGIAAVAGDLQAALARPDTVALTVGAAARMFGSAQALGKRVQIDGKTFEVAALLPDQPSSTTLPYTALVGIGSAVLSDRSRNDLMTNWGSLNGRVYLKLGKTVAPAAVAALLQQAADNSPLRQYFPPEVLAQLGEKKLLELRLQALRDVYFQTDIEYDPGHSAHGDPRVVFGLAAIAILIVALAVTNYVNLSTVRTLRRQREIAMRKVLGASTSRVVSLFLAESVLVASLSTLLGLGLALALKNPFGVLVNRTLDSLFSLPNVAACLLLGVLVGLLSGAYPAWVALKVRVTEAIAGRGDAEAAGGLWLRRGLTVLQFGTAMGLTCVCIAIAWQTAFATGRSPGFDPAPLLQLDLPVGSNLSSPANQTFREAVRRVPGVLEVASAKEVVGRHKVNQVASAKRAGAAGVSLNFKGVSQEFFSTYGVNPMAGRVFSPRLDAADSNAVVINARAATMLGFASAQEAVGQFVESGPSGPLKIVGVAGDMRHTSLREQAQPLLYYLSTTNRVLTVRTDGQVGPVETAIDALWKQHFPNQVMHLQRAQSFFAADYADDLRVAKMLAASTLISMAIAAFGIYVLAAYSVGRRKREIVLRKLYGAGHAAIVGLVSREFALIIGVSALLGLPLAALVVQRYLMSFVERAPVGAWSVLAALALAALVAMGSTWRHTYAAMRMKPSVALRE